MVEMPPSLPPMLWQKSRASSPQTASCVEVARTQGHVWVRDSKDPLGPALGVTRGQWAMFLAGIQHDGFDSC